MSRTLVRIKKYIFIETFRKWFVLQLAYVTLCLNFRHKSVANTLSIEWRVSGECRELEQCNALNAKQLNEWTHAWNLIFIGFKWLQIESWDKWVKSARHWNFNQSESEKWVQNKRKSVQKFHSWGNAEQSLPGIGVGSVPSQLFSRLMS